MWAVKILIVPFLIFSCANSEGNDYMDHVEEVQEYCEIRENFTTQYSENSVEDSLVETYEWKCMMECMATELGIFRNHRFYDKGFKMMVMKIFPEQDEMLQPILRMIASKCRTKDFNDRCEAAYDFIKCLEEIVDISVTNLVDN